MNAVRGIGERERERGREREREGEREGGGRESKPVFRSQSLQGEDRCRLDPCSCQLQDDPPVHTD